MQTNNSTKQNKAFWFVSKKTLEDYRPNKQDEILTTDTFIRGDKDYADAVYDILKFTRIGDYKSIVTDNAYFAVHFANQAPFCRTYLTHNEGLVEVTVRPAQLEN